MLIRHKVVEFMFPFVDGAPKLSGGDNKFRELAPRQESTVRSEDLSGEVQGESGETRQGEPTGDAEVRADLWSIHGDFINRHHNGPRVQLFVPKEETFPIPLIFFDVTRSSHPDLDVMFRKTH